jgi:hypothetical protein
MEYKIVTAQHLLSSVKGVEKLTKAVNDLIALGWEPIGGVTFKENSGLAVQAMIKRR